MNAKAPKQLMVGSLVVEFEPGGGASLRSEKNGGPCYTVAADDWQKLIAAAQAGRLNPPEDSS